MRKIIIDTDPGQDDAVAILTALGSPDDLDVLGICSVAGNVPLHHTTANALRLVDLAGSEVPVHRGCSRPMVYELVTAEHVHGPTGLDGSGLPGPLSDVAEPTAVEFLIETLSAAEQASVTLVVLGPMTNVGMALVQAPAIAPAVDRIVAMGGGFFEGGNITPAAEFNLYVDPHAAHVVFGSGIPITLMPLDVTHRAISTPERISAFRDLATPAGVSVAGMLAFSERYDIEKYGAPGGPLHDPTTIAYLLEPDMFEGRECNVEIVVDGPARGMTMVDWWGVTGRALNATVMNRLDADRYYALLTERIARLSS